MIRKHRSFAFHVKEIADSGKFTGYASVFDVVDYYSDVIKAGAFAESLRRWQTLERLPPLLWQHDSRQPIGPHTVMVEDSRGLYVEGLLLVDDIPVARQAHSLLKNKVINGMSIGFDIAEDGAEYDGKTNIWNLLKINLWENSLVTFPANEEARVEQVKSLLSAGKLPSLSEFEDLLRDVAGFTRKQAKLVCGSGYRTLLRDAGETLRDEEGDAETAKAIGLPNILEYLEKR